MYVGWCLMSQLCFAVWIPVRVIQVDVQQPNCPDILLTGRLVWTAVVVWLFDCCHDCCSVVVATPPVLMRLTVLRLVVWCCCAGCLSCRAPGKSRVRAAVLPNVQPRGQSVSQSVCPSIHPGREEPLFLFAGARSDLLLQRARAVSALLSRCFFVCFFVFVFCCFLLGQWR